MRRSLAGIFLALSIGLVPSVEAQATMDAVFSTSFNQYGSTSDGGITLIQHRLYHSDTVIDDVIGQFVPSSVGLDAVDLLRDGAILFSVESFGVAYHTGGLIALNEHEIYRFDPVSGEITVEVDWAEYGIDLDSLDALDRVTSTVYAFSTEAHRLLQHAGGLLTVFPENVYAFNATTGVIELLFDGSALGLADLDAVDIFADGRIGFSTASNVWVWDGSTGHHLKPQDVYVFDDGALTRALDGDARDILSVDAVHLGDTDVQVDVDIEGDRILVSSHGDTASYDVVVGDLGTLIATDGDFSLATTQCLVAEHVGPEVTCACTPLPGEGIWILVRRNAEDSTFDSGGRHQIRSRDAGIAASGADCS